MSNMETRENDEARLIKDHRILQIAHLLCEKRLGRRSLASATHIHEMEVRSLLERLRDLGLVGLHKAGATLTERGGTLLRPTLERIERVSPVSIESIPQVAVAIGAHLRSSLFKPSWSYRDTAIREGAAAILILVSSEQGLRFINDGKLLRTYSEHDNQTLIDIFPDMLEGELLVIVSAQDSGRARGALWSVIAEILNAPQGAAGG